MNQDPSIKINVIRSAVAISSLLLLASCGNGLSSTLNNTSVPGTASAITGTVSAGPVAGALVTVYALNPDGTQGSAIGHSTADAAGNYSLNLSPAPLGPVMIVASGGFYIEESSGTTVPLGAAVMRTVVSAPTNGQKIGVTPVTEIAAQSALTSLSANRTVDPALLIKTANSLVASSMGLSDITIPPADPTKPASQAQSTEAAKYAVVLAAISKAASTAAATASTSVTSLDMMQALATSFTYNQSFSSTVSSSGNTQNVPVTNGSGASLNLGAVFNALGGSGASFSTALQAASQAYVNTTNATQLGFNNASLAPPPTFNVNPVAPAGAPTIIPPVPPTALPTIRPSDSGPPPAPNANLYPVLVRVQGLGGNLMLSNNGTDMLPVSSNGIYPFSVRLAASAPYAVTVLAQPVGQVCQIINGIGTAGVSTTTVSGTLPMAVVQCVGSWPTTINDGVATGSFFVNGSATDAAGSVLVVGQVNTTIDGLQRNGQGGYFVSKYNSGSKRVWTVQDQAVGKFAQGNAVAVDPVGNVIVGGFTTGGLNDQIQKGNLDYFVTKFSQTGVRLWTVQKGALGGTTQANGVATDSMGNIYVTGNTTVGLDGRPLVGTSSFFISKYDPTGNLLWTNLGAPLNGSASGISVAVAPFNGNVMVYGKASGAFANQVAHGSTDYFLTALTPFGASLWLIQDGSASSVTPGGMAVDSTGSILLTGSTAASLDLQPKVGQTDLFISKYGVGGGRLWTSEIGAPGGTTNGYGIVVDLAGNAIVGGSATAGVGGQVQRGLVDLLVVKVSPTGAPILSIQDGVPSAQSKASTVAIDSQNKFYAIGVTTGALDGITLGGSYDLVIKPLGASAP